MEGEMKKNDIVKLNIIDISFDGSGIAKELNGETSLIYFVKGCTLGDKVEAVITKVAKNCIYAKAIKILELSDFRIKCECENARLCGGCNFQELSYDKELKLKKNMVLNNIIRIGKFDKDFINEKFEGIVGMEVPYRYRNKMQFPIGENNGEIICGFYRENSHDIIPLNDCNIGFEECKSIIETIKNIIKEGNKLYKDFFHDENENIDNKNFEHKLYYNLRHIVIRKGFNTGEIGICLVVDENIKDYKHSCFVSRSLFLFLLLEEMIIKINENLLLILFHKKNMFYYMFGV